MDEVKKTEGEAPENLLEAFGRLYASAFESLLSAYSGQTVTCLCIGQSENTRDNFSSLLAEWSLMFEVQYASTPPGALGFFFRPMEAQRLCDLNGDALSARTELNEQEVKTIRAIIDEAVGMVAPQIRSKLDIACSPSALGDLKVLQQLDRVYFSAGAPILITLIVEVEALAFDAQLLMLVSPALARILSNPEEAQEPKFVAAAGAASAITGGPALGPASDRSGSKKDKAGMSSEMEHNLERILDIELPVTLNFGQTQMLLKDVLQFSSGSIIQLDRTVDDPVYLMINNKVIASGEVVVVDGNYGIRITEIESTAERIRSLR